MQPPEPFKTVENEFGLFRQYVTPPQRDPEEGLTPSAFADAPTHLRDPIPAAERDPSKPFGAAVRDSVAHARRQAFEFFAPFLNYSSFRLSHWQHTGSNIKSDAEVTRLAREYLADEHFINSDVKNFNAAREARRLVEHEDALPSSDDMFPSAKGWRHRTATLRLPKEKEKHLSFEDVEAADVSFYARNLLDVVKEAYSDTMAFKYHWFPFKLFRTRATPDAPDETPERVYSEVYNSDAMIREHEAIQALPPTEGDPANTERIVAPLLVYSDSTHLTNFGNASLWPVYIFFANLTKYIRGKPSAFAAHHLAYIPTVSTNVSRTLNEL